MASSGRTLHGDAEVAWPPSMARYERLEKLGAGINGEVFKAWDTQEKLIVAVKRLSGSGDDGFIISGLAEVAREIMCLGACRGIPSIVQHRQTCVPASQREAVDSFIVMDYVGRLNLRTYMQRRARRGQPFSEGEVRRIMKHLLEGVKAVNGVGILHMDIKPENVLLDDGTEDRKQRPKEGAIEAGEVKSDSLVYKIGGFGMSHRKGPGKRQPEVTILTPYSAPELLLHSCEYDDRVDTWGLGCIMADLLSGSATATFDGDSDIEIMANVFDIVGKHGIEDWSGYSKVAANQKSKLPNQNSKQLGHCRLQRKYPKSKLSSAGFKVLNGLLESNPTKRLTAAEALQKPWFVTPRRRIASFMMSCAGVLPEHVN